MLFTHAGHVARPGWLGWCRHTEAPRQAILFTWLLFSFPAHSGQVGKENGLPWHSLCQPSTPVRLSFSFSYCLSVLAGRQVKRRREESSGQPGWRSRHWIWLFFFFGCKKKYNINLLSHIWTMILPAKQCTIEVILSQPLNIRNSESHADSFQQ